MIYRKLTPEDTDDFFEMMCRLDEETEFMMYEPGERREKTRDTGFLKARLEAACSGSDLLICAENDRSGIVGYIWADRGKLSRTAHSAYIVTGILKAYRRQGIGTEFFRLLDEWARSSGVTRLELTVECENTAAVRLYEKCGFVIEGRRVGSMKINGKFADEYYMAKIIEI